MHAGQGYHPAPPGHVRPARGRRQSQCDPQRGWRQRDEVDEQITGSRLTEVPGVPASLSVSDIASGTTPEESHEALGRCVHVPLRPGACRPWPASRAHGNGCAGESQCPETKGTRWLLLVRPVHGEPDQHSSWEWKCQ